MSACRCGRLGAGLHRAFESTAYPGVTGSICRPIIEDESCRVYGSNSGTDILRHSEREEIRISALVYLK